MQPKHMMWFMDDPESRQYRIVELLSSRHLL